MNQLSPNMEDWLRKISKSSVDFIGYPCRFGQEKTGVDTGPAVLRKHGIITQLQDLNIPTNDLGDVEMVDHGQDEKVHNVKRPTSIGEANKKLSSVVKGVLKEGHMCVALGGDHSIGIGSVHGHSQASPGLKVVWLDAHADINPPLDSPTGSFHGMPVCFLARELKHFIPEGMPGFDWFQPCISVKDIVYIGLRDVDQAERKVIKQHQIKSFSACDVSRLGIGEVLKQTLDYLKPSKDHPLHLSLDVDGLDPIHSASTGTPVVGGLSLREGMNVVETLASTGFLEVLVITEVNPAIGTEAQRLATLDTANELVASAFARRDIMPFVEE